MGIDSQKAEKQLTGGLSGDKLVVKPADEKPAFDGASMLQTGDAAARNYGKDARLGNLPTNDDLLKQIDHDQKQKVSGFDRLPFDKEKEMARSLSPEELKNIGSIVDAIKHQKTGAAGGTSGENVGDLVKHFQNNPSRLVALKDMIQLELERQDMVKNYQVDVMGYQEKGGKAAAVLLVSKTKDHSSIGITTDGKKAPKELLNFLYD